MRTILSVIELTNETENSQEMMYNTTTMGDVNTNYSEECGLMDDEYVLISSTVQWWCEGALFAVVGLIGLVVNIISVGILSTSELRKHTFNQLLIAHCLIDLGFIIVSVPVYTFNIVFFFDTSTGFGKIFIQLYVTALYPLSAVMLCASVYMTVAITIERYLAVCRPIFYRNLTRTMTSARRVALYVTPVLLVSSCLNIPKFMETQTSSGSDDDDQTNGTTSGNYTDNTIKVQAADIRLDPTYMLYYTISQIFHPTLTTGIAPMVALIFMNTSIFFGIRKTVAARNQRRAAPSSNPQQNGPATNQSRLAINQLDDRAGGLNNNHPNQPHGSTPALSSTASPRPATVRENRKTETNLAVVLIGITTMHLICHALRVFLATYAVYLNTTWVNCMKTQNSYAPPLWTMCAEHISSIMIMINLAGNFLIYCSVLKPFKAYLVERCGSSVWLKLFRRINEYITSRRRRGGNNNAPDIIMTTPPPNTVQIRQIGNSIDTENKTVFTPTPIQDTEAIHLKNKLNGDKVNEEDDPLINNTVSAIHANELSTSNEKPQTSRPRGRGSSVRLEKKKILAKAGRGLSFLSHFSKKANDKVNEDNLEQGNSNSTRSERIKSEGDIKITKGKNNITVGKKCTLISDSINDNEAEATMLTQVIEHDHNEDTHGMQQFMVESEGGTVLIDCTNVTIVKADQTTNKPYHLYENQNCGSTHDVCSQKAPDSTRQNRKADKKDGFSQT